MEVGVERVKQHEASYSRYTITVAWMTVGTEIHQNLPRSWQNTIQNRALGSASSCLTLVGDPEPAWQTYVFETVFVSLELALLGIIVSQANVIYINRGAAKNTQG